MLVKAVHRHVLLVLNWGQHHPGRRFLGRGLITRRSQAAYQRILIPTELLLDGTTLEKAIHGNGNILSEQLINYPYNYPYIQFIQAYDLKIVCVSVCVCVCVING
jgi:hypothetical protein